MEGRGFPSNFKVAGTESDITSRWEETVEKLSKEKKSQVVRPQERTFSNFSVHQKHLKGLLKHKLIVYDRFLGYD